MFKYGGHLNEVAYVSFDAQDHHPRVVFNIVITQVPTSAKQWYTLTASIVSGVCIARSMHRDIQSALVMCRTACSVYTQQFLRKRYIGGKKKADKWVDPRVRPDKADDEKGCKSLYSPARDGILSLEITKHELYVYRGRLSIKYAADRGGAGTSVAHLFCDDKSVIHSMADAVIWRLMSQERLAMDDLEQIVNSPDHTRSNAEIDEICQRSASLEIMLQNTRLDNLFTLVLSKNIPATIPEEQEEETPEAISGQVKS